MSKHNLIEELDEMVYVSDIETYEILYLSKNASKYIDVENYKGKKCYEVMQGRDSVCPFCTNHILNSQMFYTWEHENKFLNKRYILKDKLIKWQGRDARMEIAIEITDKEQTGAIEKNRLKMEHAFIRCIEAAKEKEDFSAVINTVLKEIGDFYEGDRACIFEVINDGKMLRNTFEWCKEGILCQKEYLQDVDISLFKRWMDTFQKENFLIIHDMEDIKPYSFMEYEILAAQNISNLITVPLKDQQKIIGFICVDNPQKFASDPTLLYSLSYFIVSEMNKKEIENRLAYVSFYDPLTGFLNRNRFMEDLKNTQLWTNISLGVVYFNINQLGYINTTKGYDYGDFYIKAVADILKKVFFDDTLYRMGGDKFVVICPDITYDKLKEKIKSFLCDADLIQKDGISVGYAFTLGRRKLPALIESAHTMMIKEKQKYYAMAMSYKSPALELKRCEVQKKLANHKNRNIPHKKGIFLPDEKAYKKRIFEYNMIVQLSYDEIYEMNLQKDKIYLIYKDSILADYPYYKSIDETINYVCDNIVHPDDRSLYRKFFHKQNMEYNLKNTIEQKEVEYRRRGKDGMYYWVSNQIKNIVYPKEISDTEEEIIVLLVKNINEAKKEREKGRIIENKYYMALKNTCDFIWDIDIESAQYVITINKEHIMENIPPKGDYNEQIEYMANHLIEKDHKENWLFHMNLSKMVSIFQKDKKEITINFCMRDNRNEYLWYNIIAVYLKGDSIQPDSIFMLGNEITAQKKVEQLNLRNELLRQEIAYQKEISLKDARYRIVVEQTGAGVFEWRTKRSPLQSVPVFEQNIFVTWEMASEFQFEQNSGDFFSFLIDKNKIHEKDKQAFFEFTHLDETSYKEIYSRVTKDGIYYGWYKFTLTSIADKDSQYNRMIGTMLDADAEMRAKEELKQRAEQDHLTGILNQEAFYIKAERLIKEYPKRDYAVIIMDIDKFKVVNDLYTMKGGNKILIQIARLIEKCLTDHDICARFYADVFYILADCSTNVAVVQLINHIIKGIENMGEESLLSPYFGISRIADEHSTIITLCEMAGFAHKFVKETHFNRWTFYDDTIKQRAVQDKQIEREMEYALENEQFIVYLQPKYRLKDKEVVGAEALVRWMHPTKGLIPPNNFIPVFERNGFILKLDAYVWQKTCMILRRWMAEGRKMVPVSVNVSRLHLRNLKFRNIIIKLTQKYGIPRKFLELELTESLFFGNVEHMVRILSSLRREGFTLDMDDFGSGYSSLNVLRNIPIDVLKIDCKFLDDAKETEKGKTIIKYVVAMARDLAMDIVAEGVETKEQEQLLIEMGCKVGQGYYFSKPITVEEFEQRY